MCVLLWWFIDMTQTGPVGTDTAFFYWWFVTLYDFQLSMFATAVIKGRSAVEVIKRTSETWIAKFYITLHPVWQFSVRDTTIFEAFQSFNFFSSVR